METTEFFVKACIILNAIRMIATGPLQSWTYELLEITSGTSDPDIIDVKLELVRLGRWEFGFTGFLNFKVDLYDDVTVHATVERSKNRAGPYFKCPMAIENQTFSHVMNFYYKPLLQPDAMKCCENAPIVKENFKPPLTKRNLTMTNCSVGTDNLPNIMMEGYYRARLLFAGPVEVFIETLSFVEAKNF